LGVQKTLEDANIKLDSVLTDVMGKSGRAMIEALIAGETNPTKWPALPIGGSRRHLRNCVRPFVAA
jgi:transposase